MQRKIRWIVGGVLAAAVGVGSTGIGLAASESRDDEPLTGETRDRAIAAATEATGGGTVTETEVGDDGASSSVEVRLQNGRQVEVDLDGEFRVTGQEADDDGPEDDDGANDD
jgi:hypothetical protein